MLCSNSEQKGKFTFLKTIMCLFLLSPQSENTSYQRYQGCLNYNVTNTSLPYPTLHTRHSYLLSS